MRKGSCARYVIITVTGACTVTAIAFFSNVWVFHSIPSLSDGLSPNEALFLEGLFVLVLGIVILLGLPHTTHDIHGIGAKDPESHREAHFSSEVQALGFALVIAFIAMLLMSFSESLLRFLNIK